MIKSAITSACLILGCTSSPVKAQDVGTFLDQCLEAVTTRDVAVFGDLPTIVEYGEPGDDAIRRLFSMDSETTGVSEMGFAFDYVFYEPTPRLGADCAVTMILNDATSEAAVNFRKTFAKQFGPVTEREKDEYSAEVDEFACLPNGFPLRLVIRTNETSIRMSIWDSLPDRPGC